MEKELLNAQMNNLLLTLLSTGEKIYAQAEREQNSLYLSQDQKDFLHLKRCSQMAAIRGAAVDINNVMKVVITMLD